MVIIITISILEDNEAVTVIAVSLSNLTHEFMAAATAATKGPFAALKFECNESGISKVRSNDNIDDKISAYTDVDLMHKSKKKPLPKLDPTGMVYLPAVA